MSEIKKVSIIGTVGLPAKYGGWETLVHHLTKNLSDCVEFEVYCSSKRYTEKLDFYNGAKLKYVGLDANGVQSTPYDFISMLRALKYSDTLLILGVSGCVFLPIIKFISRKKIIVNIDGLEWKRDKWGKFAKWFLRLSESIAVKYADITISDNKAIQNYVFSKYGKKAELIAYGSDHVRYIDFSNEDISRYSFLKKKYAFKVCRIEPENNIHVILKAFSTITQYDLVIVGNWNNSSYGIDLKDSYSSFDHIYLLDPIYDQDQLNILRGNCCIYIHGHSAGGTNPSLVEAMFLGLPIIAYSVSYNIETTHNLARYFNSEVDLIKTLNLIELTDLSKIAKNMKTVAEANYTWQRISQQYKEIF